MADLFLGLDVGTTAIKGALFDARGRAVAQAGRRYPTARPAPGIVEQNPQDWVEGVRFVLDALGHGERVAAVGLCSQVNTDVFVDAAGRALAPAIAWQDSRAAADAAELDAAIPLEDRLAWWGAPLPVGASHVLARMAWMRRERPDVFAATRYVLSPKDYCLGALAGAAVSDAMSSFFVVGLDLAYVEPLLARVEGARERLAPLKGFTEVVGEIALAQGRRVPVVTGTMDAWSGVLGAGVSGPGQGVYMSGTSEIVAVASAARIGAPGVVTFPRAEGLTINAGPTQAGGDSLQFWAEACGGDAAAALENAAKADRRGRPVLFLPHLEGERAPLWDASLRGAFVGLDRRTGGPEMALAVLEGVALSARLLFEAVDKAAGGGTARLFHAGGGARSDLWAQIRADCLGLPLDRVAHLDVGCLGAAMMAAVGAGAFGSLDAASAGMARIERTFEPDLAMKPRYDALFAAYGKATQALKEIGSELGG